MGFSASAGHVQPIVAELVGPAAAGKTSLLLAISRQDPAGCARLRPPPYQYLRHAVPLAGTFLSLHRPYRGLLWKEMKRITYLATLRGLLRREVAAGRETVLMDEGAVYMFARLLVYGGGRTASRAFGHWWKRAITEWADELHLLVCLDAPDPELVRRMRARPQRHRMQALPDSAVLGFISEYRSAYARVIEALTAIRGLRVVTVRTDQAPTDDLARRVAAELAAIRLERP